MKRPQSPGATVLLLIALMVLILGPSAWAQPLPPATRVFTCGSDYQPVDFAFGPEGDLYSTDAGLLSSEPYNPEIAPGRQEFRLGVVYRHTERGCERIAEGPVGLFGVATRRDGQNICVSHQFSSKLPAFQDFVSCWDGGEWQPFNADFPKDLGAELGVALAFPAGISTTDEGFLVALSVASLGPPRAVYALVDERGLVRIEDAIAAVHFVVTAPDGSIYGTAYWGQNGFGGGRPLSSVIKVEQGGQVERLTSPAPHTMSSGLVNIENALWVADYAAGSLQKLDLEGRVLASYSGLEGPMGVEQAPNGELCVAEMRGARISCFRLEEMDGAQHE